MRVVDTAVAVFAMKLSAYHASNLNAEQSQVRIFLARTIYATFAILVSSHLTHA